jgi:hypothetical protein
MIDTNKSMMAVKSEWNSKPTIKLMPLTTGCPYVECIYDPESKVLAVIGMTRKNVFHMMPKLDENGDIVMRKVKAEGSKPYKEDRRSVETFQEYYISDKDQIMAFMEMFAVNFNVCQEFFAVSSKQEPVAEATV